MTPLPVGLVRTILLGLLWPAVILAWQDPTQSPDQMDDFNPNTEYYNHTEAQPMAENNTSAETLPDYNDTEDQPMAEDNPSTETPPGQVHPLAAYNAHTQGRPMAGQDHIDGPLHMPDHQIRGRMGPAMMPTTPPDLLRLPDNSNGLSRFSDLPQPSGSHCDVLLYSPVPLMTDSVPWDCVCSHCKGQAGPKGDRGNRGLPGSPGSPGIRGLMGFRGRPGFFGPRGLKGQKGDEGVKGDRGLRGYTGAKGAPGYKGNKGDQGVEGPPGDEGPQGEPGQCPASCNVEQGLAGEVGLPGRSGRRGLPGIAGPPGARGPKGDTGDLGPPGKPGMDGMKGDQGADGECDCQDGSDGSDGVPGSPGPKGEKGDLGLKGTKGDLGPKGDGGAHGMMGIPGPCTPAIQSAFSAALADSYPEPNFPVPFGRVLYNQQFHYDPESGIYRAPVNGTYVFSYHLTAFRNVLKVGLHLNYRPVVRTTETASHGSATQQVVLHLAANDAVWLQVKDFTSDGMYTDAESSSTFSGFLLHPDSCDLPDIGFPFGPFPRVWPAPTPEQGRDYEWGDLDGP